MTEHRDIPQNALRFSATAPTLSEGNGKRRFEGVAYSGAVLAHWYWGRFAIDLSTTRLSDKVPMLILHDMNKRAGVGTLSIVDNQLTVTGHLLSNEHGEAVAKESDDGFPWEMSVYVDPESVEEYGETALVSINGQTVQGPLSVFRNSEIHEVSFTPVGVDGNTAAQAMSGDNHTTLSKEVTRMPTEQKPENVEGLKASIESLTAKLTGQQEAMAAMTKRAETAEAEVARLTKDQRRESVRAFLTKLGKEDTDENASPYLEMAQPVYDAMVAAVDTALSQSGEGKQRPAAPKALFNREHPKGGDTPPVPKRKFTLDPGEIYAQRKQ